jgi:hypothetical protein
MGVLNWWWTTDVVVSRLAGTPIIGGGGGQKRTKGAFISVLYKHVCVYALGGEAGGTLWGAFD